MDSMQALVWRGPEKVELASVRRPVVRHPEDALVRITAASICGTDLHFFHGHLPVKPGIVMGHEFVGTVEDVGEAVQNLSPGQRVAASCLIRCGRCFFCLRGQYSQCPQGGMLYGVTHPGGQAESIRVPFADFGLVPIPDGVSDEAALLVGDNLSTGWYGAWLGQVEPGDSVVVLGAGPVGLCTVEALKAFSPALTVTVGRSNAHRVQKALAMGAQLGILSAEEDPAARIMSATAGRGADVVIDCAGSPASLDMAFDVVRNGGRVVLTGLYSKPVQLPLQRLFLRNLQLSWGLVDTTQMPQLLALIKAGKLDTRPLISHTLPLEDGVRAYEMLDKNLDHSLKIVLKPVAT